MLEQIGTIFDDEHALLKNLKKKVYEENFKIFQAKHGHFIDEMISFVNDSEDRNSAIDEVSKIFCEHALNDTIINGKKKNRYQIDFNFYMIYYVFPSILKTNDVNAIRICDCLRDTWNATFVNTNINYTDYETLHSSFKEKIFGIF